MSITETIGVLRFRSEADVARPVKKLKAVLMSLASSIVFLGRIEKRYGRFPDEIVPYSENACLFEFLHPQARSVVYYLCNRALPGSLPAALH